MVQKPRDPIILVPYSSSFPRPMAVSLAGRSTIFRAISRSPPSIRRSTASISHGSQDEHGAYSSSTTSPSSTNRSRKMNADRLSSVIDSVNDRKLPPELRGNRNGFRSETEIMNVVERRVWHAMEEGQFEKLPGKGKPLNLSSNPHADPAEDTLYRILKKNGCAPEWVELNKDIRSKIAEWRLALKKSWMFKGGCDDSKWVELSESLKLQLRDLNNMVFRYNIIVPFGRQMFGFKWEKELDRLQEEIQAAK
ncbi:dnaJsubfamily C member 28 [Dorcoceras hygrometricum]|uniref:DnaJsubfamily C member 28 n=1 Tax=Dorcoceras hygrometricum TaxID=472368 RepID=A0A2Z7B4I6_9LAMI|nr:dnaJsubfamily C member 28 [Dorcoceras hygrometricum]